MHPFLQQARTIVEAAVEGMTTDHLVWHPPARWSTADIVEHLALACGGTTKLLEWHLGGGRLRIQPPSHQQQVMTRVLFEGGTFPPGLTAPPYAVPRGMEPTRVLSFFREAVAGLDAAALRCIDRLGGDVPLGRHPVLGPLTIAQWCQFHAVHALHHVKQIDELKHRAPRQPAHP